MTFLDQLSDAIDIQQQRQDQEYNELKERPLCERVSRGYTMTNLHAEFEFYDGAPTRFVPASIGTIRLSYPTTAWTMSKRRWRRSQQLAVGEKH